MILSYAAPTRRFVLRTYQWRPYVTGLGSIAASLEITTNGAKYYDYKRNNRAMPTPRTTLLWS